MQVVKNIVIALFVTWFAVLLFMPKQELYYSLEKELLTQGIESNEKQIKTGIFSLTIKDAEVYVKGIKIATLDELSFFTLLFYNSLTVEGVKIDSSLSAFAPEEISKILLMHSVLSPSKAYITAMGSFGLAEGVVDLNSSTLRIDLVDAKDIGNLKSQLKKDDKGWYYETSF
jgi:hypothetical protein